MADEPRDTRRFPRVPLALLVQLRFDTVDDFVSEYAVNVSKGGLFVRSKRTRPVGSLVYVQFSLRDGSRLIEGLARVVRLVGGDEPGMALEFVRLDDESKELLEDVIRRSQKER